MPQELERRNEIREVSRGQIPKRFVNLHKRSELHSKANAKTLPTLSRKSDRQHTRRQEKNTSKYAVTSITIKEVSGLKQGSGMPRGRYPQVKTNWELESPGLADQVNKSR